MSVLALVFFSDLHTTIRARLVSSSRWMLIAASVEPRPAIPRDKPHLLHDAGRRELRFDDRWREGLGRDAVYRSLWML
ncbi:MULTISPECIES: hypothetical protein [Ensifer]|jgi:hypothetical protein|uniref:hypothetical protein n=1 Tax=Ensifer TaxID=106591 RepID=UPI000710B424|nr:MULTISPECIES: hypothetical protein [Ensifer]MDP9631237.1 hypothetical protein [Ensifer adhaerens]KQU95428.1 hypothetical protein ASD00_21020 [Ensifer sp. Root31]KQW59991.1 hypothetical protein ASD03_14850 [Ensifer sp. Root127]MBD9489743.1 hypothetical protein [Ensifer sp. ENS11]NOV18994.1 hypothetical protein [Ensifer canadensis]